MWSNIKITFLLLLVGVFTVFVLQNTSLVTVRLIATEVELSLVVVLLLTLLIGFIVGFLTAKLTSRKQKKKKQAKMASPNQVAAPKEGPAPPETMRWTPPEPESSPRSTDS